MQLIAREIEVTYRKSVEVKKFDPIKSSSSSADLFRKFIPEDKMQYKEFFYIALLDNSLNILGVHKLSEGGITGTLVDMRLLFGIAVKANASNIIVCHNHPSGNLMPSTADRELTERIGKAGKILAVKLLDHIILTQDGYRSFSDHGEIY